MAVGCVSLQREGIRSRPLPAPGTLLVISGARGLVEGLPTSTHIFPAVLPKHVSVQIAPVTGHRSLG